MKLTVLGSSSSGNGYILQSNNEALLIECGIHTKEVKRELNFIISKVVGCILTHEHNDHSKYADDISKQGIKIYASEGTIEALNLTHNAVAIVEKKWIQLGGFKILPFKVHHDAAEPFGYLIDHEETGRILFMTDTYYCDYTFNNLSHVLIEANYSEAIVQEKLSNHDVVPFLRNRILQSHMSLETCLKALKSYDLRMCENIVLIHLSDSNSDALNFKQEVEKATQKNTIVAENKMTLELNKTPF